MTDAQTEAWAIVDDTHIEFDTSCQYDALVDRIAVALAAKDAELATLREADGNFWEAIARAERAEAHLAEVRKALEPFAWIGQWLFARDLPDETPVVMVEGAGKPFALTRGMFKAAHTAARRALEGGQEE